MKHIKIALAATLMLSATTAFSRDQIRIVGSSTVFPFSTAVAEKFGQNTAFKTPVVESTGTGGGMKLFCVGVGENTPDITNASRRIKSGEFEKCVKNGVTPVEVKTGFDGIVLANAKAGSELKLTLKQIFLGLAKHIPDANGKLIANPNTKWSDIDPALPAVKIEVLGPPPTSGTRDAFEELAMGGGAKKFALLKELRGLKKADPRIAEIAATIGLASAISDVDLSATKGKSLFKKVAYELREDGAYIEAGENDNLIVQKLNTNENAIGIFGFSFLDQNSDTLKGATVNGVKPEFEEIANGNYKISRSLYFYIKKEHVGVVPGISEFVAEFVGENAVGDDGYLAEKGLIPLTAEERKAVAASATQMTPMAM